MAREHPALCARHGRPSAPTTTTGGCAPRCSTPRLAASGSSACDARRDAPRSRWDIVADAYESLTGLRLTARSEGLFPETRADAAANYLNTALLGGLAEALQNGAAALDRLAREHTRGQSKTALRIRTLQLDIAAGDDAPAAEGGPRDGGS